MSSSPAFPGRLAGTRPGEARAREAVSERGGEPRGGRPRPTGEDGERGEGTEGQSLPHE